MRRTSLAGDPGLAEVSRGGCEGQRFVSENQEAHVALLKRLHTYIYIYIYMPCFSVFHVVLRFAEEPNFLHARVC